MEYKYETHLHTKESSMCAKSSAADQVRAYQKRGYTGIIVTDHIKSFYFKIGVIRGLKPLTSWNEKVKFFIKGYEKAKNEGDKIGLDVFLGWEFYYRGADFLTYGLDIDFLLKNKDLDEMPVEAYSKLVRDNGGYIAQAHPYRKPKMGDMERPVEPHLLDGAEVFNASKANDLNEKADEFALRHNLPIQAGTDSHKAYSFGDKDHFYSGIIMNKRAENIFDIISAIKSKNIQLILPSKDRVFIDDENSMLVKIFYDCKHARESAEALCKNINESMEIEAVCYHSDQEGKIDRTARINKTIIIGHHSDTKKRISYIKNLKYNKYEMRYGFDDNLCVLTASKSKLLKSKQEHSKFIVDYCKKFDDNPMDEYIRATQFKFLITEFMENGLEEFLSI